MLRMLDWALEEDLGRGDCTSNSSVPATLEHEGFILTKEAGVVAGIEVAREVFKRVDPEVVFEAKLADGDAVSVGDVVIRICAAEQLYRAHTILKGEPYHHP